MSDLKPEQFSLTENHGLEAMPTDALNVLSVGVSTGGVAEMRMASMNPERHIIATTIDERGIKVAQNMIEQAGLLTQVELKIEDVSQPLPYADETFDFIYARLVLHYLSRQALDETLPELRRVLKAGRQLFTVVRSADCPDAHSEGATYNNETGLTTYIHPVKAGGETIAKRYFHSEESIAEHMSRAGFKIEHVKSIDERLFADFGRTMISPHIDNLIEVLATA